MWVSFLFILIFIVCSAFFSASETAIFSLGLTRLRGIKSKSQRRHKVLSRLLKRPSYLLATIVFGNMLVNVGLASLTTAVCVELFHEKGALIAILFSGSLILVMGEILPKTIAIYLAEQISLLAAPVIDFVGTALRPVIVGVQRLSDKVAQIIVGRQKGEVSFTEEELKTALSLGRKEGQITEAEEEMISYVLRFKDTSASQIMTPRVETVAIEEGTSQEEIFQILRRMRHSKFPVYRGSLDNVRGIIYSKDVFLHPRRDWHVFIREAIFVPESQKIDDILKVFIEKKERIAVVLDEYGGTAGIVTFEDIVEEIFGEIYDEYEFPQEPVEKIDENTYRVFGKTPIKTVNLGLDVNLPEEEDTVAGLILSRMEKIPSSGERLDMGQVEFEVERASRRRIISVIIRVRK